MDNVDNVDWTKFLERKRISKSDAARLLGAAPAMVTEWIKGKNNPTHKYLKRLCMAGMTAQEMFGVEAGDELVRNSMNSRIIPSDYNTPGFREAVMNIFAEIEKKKAAKAAGVPKDEEAVR